MDLLSAEVEREALDVVKEAISKYNETTETSPTEAITKASEGHDFTPSMLCRLVEAYNGSAQLAHLEGAEAEKRAEEVPLADAQKVVSHFFPDEVLTQTQKQANEEVPRAYNTPQRTDFMRITDQRVKSAADKLVDQRPRPRKYQIDKNALFQKIRLKKEAGERKVVQFRTEARNHLHKVAEIASELGQYCRSISRLPFAEMEKVSLAYFGDGIKTLLDYVYTDNHLEKMGETRGDKQDGVVFLNDSERPYDLIKSALTHRKQYAETLTKLAEVHEATAVEYKGNMAAYREYKEAADNPFGLGGLGARLEGIDKALTQPKDPAPILSADVVDPEHEARLAAIRQQAVLSDMMQNDPVISAVDPQTVINAFNELSDLAPNVAREPSVLKSLLRRRVQQADVDPFEMEQVLKMDAALQKRDVPELSQKVLA